MSLLSATTIVSSITSSLDQLSATAAVSTSVDLESQLMQNSQFASLVSEYQANPQPDLMTSIEAVASSINPDALSVLTASGLTVGGFSPSVAAVTGLSTDASGPAITGVESTSIPSISGIDSSVSSTLQVPATGVTPDITAPVLSTAVSSSTGEANSLAYSTEIGTNAIQPISSSSLTTAATQTATVTSLSTGNPPTYANSTVAGSSFGFNSNSTTALAANSNSTSTATGAAGNYSQNATSTLGPVLQSGGAGTYGYASGNASAPAILANIAAAAPGNPTVLRSALLLTLGVFFLL